MCSARSRPTTLPRLALVAGSAPAPAAEVREPRAPPAGSPRDLAGDRVRARAVAP